MEANSYFTAMKNKNMEESHTYCEDLFREIHEKALEEFKAEDN